VNGASSDRGLAASADDSATNLLPLALALLCVVLTVSFVGTPPGEPRK
jgi:hypothetical protein